MTAKMQKRTEITREKILSAAKQLFVEHGYAGTSIGSIAKLADINHSLIFHHFGSKENLWVAVKVTMADEANQSTPITPSLEQPFASFLEELLSNMLNFYQEYPEIVRMIYWQRLDHAADNISIAPSKHAMSWHKALEHYQKKGEIRKNLNLDFVFTMLAGILSSAGLDPNTFFNKKSQQQAYIKFCVDSLCTALR